jgi:hypothetical protein
MTPFLQRRAVRGLLVVILLYLPSLFLPTLIPAEGDPSFLLGIVCLLLGWTQLSWFANPLLLVAAVYVLARRPRWALVPAALAIPIALSALGMDRVWINEAGTEADVVGYGWGFYLWIASLVAMLGTAVWSLGETKEAGVTSPKGESAT